MNNNWLRACLLNHGLTEKEANKVLLSKDNIVSTLKDIILDAYDIINDMEEHIEYNNVNYLYPTLSNQGQGKVSDKAEVTNTKDKLYSIAGKSNPDLLQAILDLENIYLTALDRFEKCFMGIY